jgi:hypothetical protein
MSSGNGSLSEGYGAPPPQERTHHDIVTEDTRIRLDNNAPDECACAVRWPIVDRWDR